MLIYPLSSKARGWLISVLKRHVKKCASISSDERENWILSWSKIKPTSLHQWPFLHTKITAIHSWHHLSAFSSWVSFPSRQLFCTLYFINFAFYNHSISPLVARILLSSYRCLWRTPSFEISFMSLCQWCLRNSWNIFNFIQFKIKNPIYYIAIFLGYICLYKNYFM